MSDTPLVAPVSLLRLTEQLRQRGLLKKGSVVGLYGHRPVSSTLALTQRIDISYDTVDGDLPSTAFLKTARPADAARGSKVGHGDFQFYTRVAPAMPSGIVPACYDASLDDSTGAWYLLLEDLSESHYFASEWPIPPTKDECASIIDVHARSHAAWWDSADLAYRMPAPTPESECTALERNAILYEAFAKRLGDRLSPSRRGLYERLFSSPAKVAARFAVQHDLTLLHGDAHVWNVFLPRDSQHSIKLFDWDSWAVGVATDDLAYMMAMHWHPEQRARIEGPLLDRYHAALRANGVLDYGRDALAEDYRWSALRLITRPVRQERHGLPASIWWNNMERIMLAVEALNCRALLG